MLHDLTLKGHQQGGNIALCEGKDCFYNKRWSCSLKLSLLFSVSNTIGCLHTSRKKGKAIPLQAGTGPEGSRRLRLPDFKTVGT